MQGKNIKIKIRKKIESWANSVTDNDEVKNAILEKTICTGGAIVSLLQNEEPNDYDIYFRDIDSLKLVVDYYIDKFSKEVEEAMDSDDEKRKEMFKHCHHFGECKPLVQRCEWVDKTDTTTDDYKVGYWRIMEEHEPNTPDTRLRVFIRSDGIVGENVDAHSDASYRADMNNFASDIKCAYRHKKKKDKRYALKYATNNAITLSDKIQIVLRFYGEPEDLHKNYDYVHCTSYYTSWDNHLELPSRALESIINKELYYIGSKYPLCSIIRSRKFIKRGWNINAGQYLKMVLQLNDLDLKNLHVFEEQLIGVDSLYFGNLISAVEGMAEHNDGRITDTGFLINLVNKVFDENCVEEYECDEDIDMEEEEDVFDTTEDITENI